MLFLLYGVIALCFGVCLSVLFSGIRFNRQNILIFSGLYCFSGGLQLAVIILLSEDVVWKLYPIITHLPLILLLTVVYRKRFVTASAAVFTAYLFCQPSKWLGELVLQLSASEVAALIARCLCLMAVGYVAIHRVAGCLSEIFNKDNRSVIIFGIVPTVYYLFDYATAIYTDLWNSNNPVVEEFLPLFLAVVYTLFCLIYYEEYEQKAEAQRREQIIRITLEQQTKEINVVRRSEQEIRLLRHDMRMLLSSLAVSVENGETENALEMIAHYTSHIEGTQLKRFCSIDTINYVLSDYEMKCQTENIPFACTVELPDIHVDEIHLCSILSNALDNALNAQKLLPTHRRSIRVMLKYTDQRLLLSVKNPVGQKVVFADGLPVSIKQGHGYGTQSIRLLTERLGGNCQFSVQDDTFILRIVL